MSKFSKRRSFSSQQLVSMLNQLRSQLDQDHQERQQLKLLLENMQQQQSQIIELLQANSSISTATITPKSISLSAAPHPKIDYHILQNLLAAKKWQDADQETARIMLVLTKKEDKGCLNEADLSKLPCVDLETIDQLWLNASDHHFGFSVQRQLYQNLGGTKFFEPEIWRNFGHTVGWYNDPNWLKYEALNFSEQAPSGHLPIMGDSQVWFVSGWEGSYRNFSGLLSRLAYCQI